MEFFCHFFISIFSFFRFEIIVSNRERAMDISSPLFLYERGYHIVASKALIATKNFHLNIKRGGELHLLFLY